jgi:hypothetical protein
MLIPPEHNLYNDSRVTLKSLPPPKLRYSRSTTNCFLKTYFVFVLPLVYSSYILYSGTKGYQDPPRPNPGTKDSF